MRQGRAAGVVPGGEPERSDVGRSIGKLANQNGSRFIVEAVVILVGIGIFSATRIAICKKNRFEPAMGPEASIKRVVGRIADEGCIVWPHRKKRGVAVNQRAAETLVDSSLPA